MHMYVFPHSSTHLDRGSYVSRRVTIFTPLFRRSTHAGHISSLTWAGLQALKWQSISGARARRPTLGLVVCQGGHCVTNGWTVSRFLEGVINPSTIRD